MKILILGGNGMIGHKLYQVISKKYPNTWVLFKKKYETEGTNFKLQHPEPNDDSNALGILPLTITCDYFPKNETAVRYKIKV